MSCCDDVWEEAYRRFETPPEEIRKFRARLLTCGAPSWDRESRIVELFCGRGNGIRALQALGFRCIEGVDLSPALLQESGLEVPLYCGDCRELKFADASKDVLIVQGGLHHLPILPDDLAATIREVARVLIPGGRFVVVEPWRTPFLDFVHYVTSLRLSRRLWSKLDAFATMTERELSTYTRWLSLPDTILPLLEAQFTTEFRRIGWGKLQFVGRKRPD
jgi:SAM-dependent methyltransferase